MFSRLPGLSADVINDVFHQPLSAAAVSVSADAITYTLIHRSTYTHRNLQKKVVVFIIFFYQLLLSIEF